MAEINFTKAQLQPEIENPLTDSVNINLDFTSKSDFADTTFIVKIFIDYAHQKIPIDLLSEAQAIKAGENNVKLQVPFSAVGKDLTDGVLANIGKLSISILSNSNEIAKIELVIDIKRKNNTLYKIIYDPLE